MLSTNDQKLLKFFINLLMQTCLDFEKINSIYRQHNFLSYEFLKQQAKSIADNLIVDDKTFLCATFKKLLKELTANSNISTIAMILDSAKNILTKLDFVTDNDLDAFFSDEELKAVITDIKRERNLLGNSEQVVADIQRSKYEKEYKPSCKK